MGNFLNGEKGPKNLEFINFYSKFIKKILNW